MPSFMPIGLKLWALEGYKQTDRQCYFTNIDLQASPAGLLGRFAHLGLSSSRSHTFRASCSQKFLKKKVCLNRHKML